MCKAEKAGKQSVRHSLLLIRKYPYRKNLEQGYLNEMVCGPEANQILTSLSLQLLCPCHLKCLLSFFLSFLNVATQSSPGACRVLELSRRAGEKEEAVTRVQEVWHCWITLPRGLREFPCHFSLADVLHIKNSLQKTAIVKYLAFMLLLSVTVFPQSGCRWRGLLQSWKRPNGHFSTVPNGNVAPHLGFSLNTKEIWTW